jgi:hypothetical protein
MASGWKWAIGIAALVGLGWAAMRRWGGDDAEVVGGRTAPPAPIRYFGPDPRDPNKTSYLATYDGLEAAERAEVDAVLHAADDAYLRITSGGSATPAAMLAVARVFDQAATRWSGKPMSTAFRFAAARERADAFDLAQVAGGNAAIGTVANVDWTHRGADGLLHLTSAGQRGVAEILAHMRVGEKIADESVDNVNAYPLGPESIASLSAGTPAIDFVAAVTGGNMVPSMRRATIDAWRLSGAASDEIVRLFVSSADTLAASRAQIADEIVLLT